MTRLVPALLLSFVAVTGCLGGPGTPTPIDSPDTPAFGETPGISITERGNISVNYVVRAGSIPDNVAHVYVDFSVYFPELSDDIYSCIEGAPLLDGKYDPSATPLEPPAGQYKSFEVPKVDIATLNGTKSLGPFNTDPMYSGGHTLVVHDVTVVLENGSTASDVYDTDFRAITEQAPPSGTYGVEIGVAYNEDADESYRSRFVIESLRFDPAED